MQCRQHLNRVGCPTIPRLACGTKSPCARRFVTPTAVKDRHLSVWRIRRRLGRSSALTIQTPQCKRSTLPKVAGSARLIESHSKIAQGAPPVPTLCSWWSLGATLTKLHRSLLSFVESCQTGQLVVETQCLHDRARIVVDLRS